ncbi:hypothetical protein BO226_17615 [Rhodococcus sp. 2G]|uniref:hypothetical protein n=1 Tax=Rhodococcus sp. 2G TaxID=1570939 RepID=UPI00090440A6|nr:hypothetical protein [Rhodococcus sp. 2G]APE10791.1 hypothetical protein BO226_17615 [Rhodococcus sp. 2G]
MSIRDELALEICKAQCNGGRPGGIDYAAADAILARFGVVELPEPEKDEWGNPDFSNEHIRLAVYSDGCTQLEVPEYFGVNAGVHPFQLRDLAARCLAAAHRAEAQS